MDTFSVGASWKARRETIDACASRLHQFLIALSECDPVFSKWYKLGMSRRKVLRAEIDFKNKNCLLDLLDRGRHRKDIGNEIMEDLGFGVGMWNGGTSTKMVGLNIICGSYSNISGLRSNGVTIQLPEELGDLQQSERMANALVAVATSWEPDWAGVFSLDAMNKRKFNPAIPFVDWMVYVSSKLVPNPTVPEPSSTKPVDGIGSLIVVQQVPVEAENPIHLQRVKAVETALGIKS